MLQVINFLVGVDGSISDSGINSAIEVITGVVQTILTIIYIVLGLFLIIKGAILGMQIVKAADEPQVRQEKIGSLKWLVIGIAIAYGVTGIANIITNYFKTTAGNVTTTAG